MMFSSLRSRLWLSYAMVTTAALIVVTIVFIIYIIQNPSTYRQASARLTVVAALLSKNDPEWAKLSADEIQARIEQVDQVYSTRIVIYGANRRMINDSEAALQPALSLPRFPRLRPYSILRDQTGDAWLYCDI
jgi:type IV secretory pathway VirB3-like protein